RCVRGQSNAGRPYTIVGTGVVTYYNNERPIEAPAPNAPFYGQDGDYPGVLSRYQSNSDGTVSDLNTGLVWMQSPGEQKVSFADAVAGANQNHTGGFRDWRLPTIKELYSLIHFNGRSRERKPYIDTRYFAFQFGDGRDGDRIIDSQYWSATEYVGRVMRNERAIFGVNFADGRIKAYPPTMPGNRIKMNYALYVRGNRAYGTNDFHVNGNKTITDAATGLTWMQADSGKSMSWQDALAYCAELDFAGHDDWRLPDPKELQSIVDYDRAPDATEPGARATAIDPLFAVGDPEAWYWTGTTLLEAPPHLPIGAHAVYISFGQATGYGPGGNRQHPPPPHD
ncbi:MAG: DUF1566 domain-containing protein, partial [Leptospiraceae bacterium]|nr:DUF1566 domain-containing protein [Leptospiraceae bacterium]